MRAARTQLAVGLLGSVLAAASGSPAAAAGACLLNPLDGGHGFGVLVERGAALNSGEVDGAVAVGGSLTLGGDYRIALHDAGRFVVRGDDDHPTALVVGAGMNWSGSAPNGRLQVLSKGYVKLGDLAGSAALNVDGNRASVNTRIVPAGAGYDVARRVEATIRQPVGSVGPAKPLNVPGLFTTFRNRADALADLEETVVLEDANGSRLRRPVAAGTHAYLRLDASRPNVLRLTGTELVNLRSLTFRDKPTAAGPLLVNVAATGAVDWEVTGFPGLGTPEARHVLVNIPGRADITMTGGNSLYATLFAPRATLVDRSSANIDGTVVVQSLVSGTATGNGGEIHSAPFSAALECSPPGGGNGGPAPEPSVSTSATPTPDPSTSATPSTPAPAPSSSAPAPSTPGPGLPRTGAPIIWFALAGLLLVAGGVVLRLRARRAD